MSLAGSTVSRQVLLFLAGFSTALTLSAFFALHQRHSAVCEGNGDKDTQRVRPTLRRKRVLFFGDSITQHGFNTEIHGWVSKLANWWTRRVDVLNRGYSGYNTRWARQVVDEVVVREQPDFVFVFFGANDAVDASVFQHVAIEEYGENMRFIVNVLKTRLPSVPVVLITPPPVWEEKLHFFNLKKNKPLLIDRTNERALQYAEVVKTVGREFDMPVVDAWTAMQGFSNARAEYLSDGLHLSDKGCIELFKAVQKTVEQRFPDWLPETMSMQLPEPSQIGADNIIHL